MPDRTTIIMPEPLKRHAVAQAHEEGISFGEYVRRAVEKEVALRKQVKRKKTGDPFLGNIRAFDDDGPPDLSTRIDEFLYGPRDD